MNFQEYPELELLLIGQPVEKVVIGPVSRPKPHSNTYTSRPKHCVGGFFEPFKEARKRRSGVFQQAAGFSEDEMRRPTPQMRSTLWVCNGYTGSDAQTKGGSAHE
jgi:hypothetical protein